MEEEHTPVDRLKSIKHKIIILSGKGGVGKSTVATQLAISLASKGQKVGLLDVDICGPSIPRILGLQGRDVKKFSEGWLPVYGENKNLAVMSLGFLIADNNTAVVWRGPKKSAMIKQFLEDVAWGDLDYLIVDTPPGTSDEHLSIVENLRNYNPDGAVIVTTPQGVSISDVRKEISFCHKLKLPVLGIIENMSGFICPHCKDCTNIFSSEGGKLLAEELKIKFLGKIPIDPTLTANSDSGKGFDSIAQSESLETIHSFVNSLIQNNN